MAEHARPQTVLIVDDDDGWARLIGDEVADAGFRAERVRTVEAARERLEAGERVSLVVLDALFGESLEPRGIDFARWMKQSGTCRTVPIVFCSTASGAEIRARLKDVGAGDDPVFEKPFDFTEFSKRITAILREGPS